MILLLCLLNLPTPVALSGEMVIYSDDFNAKPGTRYPEWSSTKINYSTRARPKEVRSLKPQWITNTESTQGKRRFLGEFGGPGVDPRAQTRVTQTIYLTLRDLPSHETATVSFDLLLLKSWDGSSPQYGPDRWKFSVEGGPTLLNTTFSNNPKIESDKSLQDYPKPQSMPKTEAISVNAMGYGFFGDSTYHFQFSLPHNAKSLVLEFSSDLFEGKGIEDESWGLDNVQVRMNDAKIAKAKVLKSN